MKIKHGKLQKFYAIVDNKDAIIDCFCQPLSVSDGFNVSSKRPDIYSLKKDAVWMCPKGCEVVPIIVQIKRNKNKIVR